MMGLFGGVFTSKTDQKAPAPHQGQGGAGGQSSPSPQQRQAAAAAHAQAGNGGANGGGVNPGAGVRAARVINSFQDIPAYQSLLTMGSRAVMRVPASYQTTIVAVELGPKRCTILFDPGCVKDSGAQQIMQSLRSRLVSEGYTFDGLDIQCTSDILKAIVDDHIAKHGTGDLASVNSAKSAAKDRFMNWMQIAASEGATDLHVKVANGRGLVQMRVDGELEMMRCANKGVYTEKEAVEAMAWVFNLNSTRGSNSASQFDPSRNLYCMTEAMPADGKKIALRYQSLRGFQGPKMIARLLNVDTQAPTLTYSQLGYAPSQRKLLLDVANTPAGFGLFAGVTGSGKTTTLKTFVETHPGNGKMAIYSMEDPVEYPMKGVHQIVLQRDVSDKDGSIRMYNETVAGLMRADPEIVIVGEIRDAASAGAGQQIVETGHMSLGTVHAHLISGIFPRLTNQEVGMSRDVLTNPNMLALLAYQALVPKICPRCGLGHADALVRARESDRENPETSFEEVHLSGVLRNIDERFKLNVNSFRFKNPDGCSFCNGRGTKGVTVVAEMMMPDRQWLELTRAGHDYEAAVSYRMKSDGRFDNEDMRGKTIFEHTLFKSLQGMVDPRQCERFDTFERFELRPQFSGIK